MNSNAALKIPETQKPKRRKRRRKFRKSHGKAMTDGTVMTVPANDLKTVKRVKDRPERSSKTGQTFIESLILAQDERWRRA